VFIRVPKKGNSYTIKLSSPQGNKKPSLRSSRLGGSKSKSSYASSARKDYLPWVDEVAIQEIVVKPIALKSWSKDSAGISLSSPEIRTRERASTKEIFTSFLENRATKKMEEI